ncbi:MAG: prolyl oligopeptidase family serine peptidase, partial [Chloroflexota bacterium]
ERTIRWTEAQNARTRAVLDALPDRARPAERLRELLAVGTLEVPRTVAGGVFHLRRQGDQKQAVLSVRDGLRGDDRALIDPNAMFPDGLTTIDWWYPSRDARYVAYGLSRGGTELSTLYVREVASGRDLGEAIPHTQHASVAWVDGGFYYTVHPAPGTVPPGDEHYHRRIRFHRLDGSWGSDPLVFGEGRPKEDIIGVTASPSGRWVLIVAFNGWISSDVYLLDRERPDEPPVTVVEGAGGLTSGCPLDDRLVLLTNIDAPNSRVVSADPREPARWTTIVPEGEHAIQGIAVTKDRVAVHTLEHAASRLSIWRLEGRKERDVELPALGSLAGVSHDPGLTADPEDDLVVYAFQSFAEPPAAFAVDVVYGGARELVRRPRPRGVARIVVEQTRYRSKDGTEVPMFLVRRADLGPRDVPTVLTGYGGFNVSRTPMYSAAAILWAELGGAYAVANLRGGGEYGERWHRAGMLGNKQNVFDDFHAAAEHLVATGWTRRERLGIHGGSNGGLLVGAVMTQRPDLYGAVVCAVPLLDMLRYHHLLIARFWIAEYGSVEAPEQFRWLRAYSPYHQVERGTHYPPVLFTTAEGDSRVDPMHARKMAARLQAETDGLVLLRVDRDAGHGVGKPLHLQVDDLADMTGFLAWRLGLGTR